MQAKIYDIDKDWCIPDGEDELGKYIIREVSYKLSSDVIVLKNGLQSNNYKFIPAMETVCEICNPELNPLCTDECQAACPLCNVEN